MVYQTNTDSCIITLYMSVNLFLCVCVCLQTVTLGSE